MSYRLLIIDDDWRSVEALKVELKPLHHEVTTANDQETAYKLLEKSSFDYALVDLRLKSHPRDLNPDIEVGYATIQFLRKNYSGMIIIAVTAFDETSEINTNAIKAGADDFWSKNPGGSGENLLTKIRRLVQDSSITISNSSIPGREVIPDSTSSEKKITSNMEDVRSRIKKFAPTDATILLLGEPGTGKGFLAEEIHKKSNRKNKTLVVVNCPQLSKSSIESELFGHKKGSFTGSIADRSGLALSADGGTLFFDEIGDLDLESQAVILRFIEQKEVKPFGSDEVKIADVRIIAATNQPLESLMSVGKFRKDLYSRLAGVVIHVPPLKDRDSKEFEKLAKYFYQKFREDHRNKKGFKDVRMKRTVWSELSNYEYDWPGNVRELMQVINTTLLEVGGKNIRVDDLIQRISADSQKTQSIKSVAFQDLLVSERQILRHVQDRGFVIRKEVEDLLHCGSTTAWSILKSMVTKDILEKTGSGKSLKYIIKLMS
jgi:two-component system, NtrC family, response regulator PilR